MGPLLVFDSVSRRKSILTAGPGGDVEQRGRAMLRLLFNQLVDPLLDALAGATNGIRAGVDNAGPWAMEIQGSRASPVVALESRDLEDKAGNLK